MIGRLIAIGDIHGEYYKLEKLLTKILPQKNDIFVFLGDYVDRGLYSKQVVDKLIELSEFCTCHFLKGNHEYYMLKSLSGDNSADYFFLTYGGVQTIESYEEKENILKLHADFYNNLKTYIKIDNFIFVHGGIKPNVPIDSITEYDLLMIRDEFIYNPTNLKEKVIFGHTPFDKPYIQNDKIGIDTGSGKSINGYITAYICNENKFIYSN